MKLVPVLIAALTLSACAASETQTAASGPKDGRACFQTSDVENWKKESDKSVLLRTRRDATYRGQLLSPCLDLDIAFQIAVGSKTGPWICEGDDAVVHPRQRDNPPESCDVLKMHRLTPEELSLIAKKDRP